MSDEIKEKKKTSEKIKKNVVNFLKQPLLYILLICILIQVKIYSIVPEFIITEDSHTYAEEYTQNIFKGEVSNVRTPVYPYFIKIIKGVFGSESVNRNVVTVQKIIFLVTLILFYSCLMKITKNKTIASLFTLILGICPLTVLWNIMILTEAVSLFEMLVLAFITISYLEKPSKIKAASTGIIVFLMIMTRPSFIYLLAIYVVFWVLKYILNREEKKEILYGLFSCFIAIVLLLGYCGLVKKNYNEFSITTISYINNGITAIDANIYKYADNKEMIDVVDNIKKDEIGEPVCWKSYYVLSERFSVQDLKNFASSSMKNGIVKYCKYIISKTINLGPSNIGTAIYMMNKEGYPALNYNNIGSFFLPVTFNLTYIILGISIVYLIYNLIKYLKINWIIAFFSTTVGGNLFTLIVGAPFESQRLFFASIPIVMMLIAYGISKWIEINKEIKEERNDKKKMKKEQSNSNLFAKLFIEKTDDVKIQFFRYIFVGGFAAVVNIGSLYIFKEFFNIHYLVSNILGFILGLLTNYILSRWLVFAKEKSMNGIIEFLIYAVIGVIGLGFDTLFMWLFTDKVKIYYMLSKIISTGLVFIWNFVGRKGIYVIANKFRKDK